MSDLLAGFAALGVNASEVGIPVILGGSSTLNNIIGMVYTVIGAMSVFYIIRGALLYVTSGSDPGSVKAARETILYAIVALVGSTMVFFVINFVIAHIGGA